MIVIEFNFVKRYNYYIFCIFLYYSVWLFWGLLDSIWRVKKKVIVFVYNIYRFYFYYVEIYKENGRGF